MLGRCCGLIRDPFRQAHEIRWERKGRALPLSHMPLPPIRNGGGFRPRRDQPSNVLIPLRCWAAPFLFKAKRKLQLHVPVCFEVRYGYPKERDNPFVWMISKRNANKLLRDFCKARRR